MQVNSFWKTIVIVLVLAVCGCVVYSIYQHTRPTKTVVEGYDPATGTYTQVSSGDDDFTSLRQENKALYDSLRKYKNQITQVTQFKYVKQFRTDTVWTALPAPADTIKTYRYASQPTDTLQYTLQIGAVKEPNWYKLDTRVRDELTIVSKQERGQTITTIQSGNKAEIEDVIIYNKPEKKKFWQRFSVGPTVGVGYDPVNRKFGMTVGVGVTYDILH